MDLVNDSSKFGWLDEERLLILLMNVDHQASRSRGQGYPLSLLGCSILLSAHGQFRRRSYFDRRCYYKETATYVGSGGKTFVVTLLKNIVTGVAIK